MIKNLILDLGQVIIPLNFNLTINKLKQHIAHNIDFSSPIFINYEKGTISTKSFLQSIKKALQLSNISDKELQTIWNSLLLPIPKENINALNQLKVRYRLFLLSNTNQLHIDYINQHLKEQHNITDFSEIFEETYLSFLLKMRKPEPEIFTKVMKENNLSPTQTLYIDDSQEHLATAKKMGIKTLWFNPETDKLPLLLKENNLL